MISSQVNFVPIGSLREVMIYPKTVDEWRCDGGTDEHLQQVLEWSHLAGEHSHLQHSASRLTASVASASTHSIPHSKQFNQRHLNNTLPATLLPTPPSVSFAKSQIW